MENLEANFENKEILRDVTIVFLIKKTEEKILEICLAMKKRGFGVNRWNGLGGKVEEGEEITKAAEREVEEEIDVTIRQTNKVAELSFYFPHNPSWNQKAHVYITENWNGEPKETEEMKPEWFKTEEIPFDQMWPADKFWIPEVLSGKLIKAIFILAEGDIVKEKNIEIVESL